MSFPSLSSSTYAELFGVIDVLHNRPIPERTFKKNKNKAPDTQQVCMIERLLSSKRSMVTS